MQSRNRLLDDLARVASGAAGTVAGVRGEVEAVVRQRIEAILSELNLVSQDEFDAVKAMAAKARREQELLEKRVQDLEEQLKLMSTTGTKKAPAKKAASKRKAAKPAASARKTTSTATKSTTQKSK